MVIDLNGKVIIGESIGIGYSETMNRALSNNYPVVDIINNNEIVGKLIIKENLSKSYISVRNSIIIAIVVFLTSLILVVFIYLLYLEFIVFRPFRKMGVYASTIVSGELDMPLEMDRGNIFGAFTESFNTMRLHIKAA